MSRPDRSDPLPPGTWTIDPADSSVSFTWRTLRLWTRTGRLRGLGLIHLDELPPVGAIRFQQPSGLPVLTMALEPASVKTQAADLDATGAGPDDLRPTVVDAAQRKPGGPAHRHLAGHGDPHQRPGQLRPGRAAPEVDQPASRRQLLVLTGKGTLDRQAVGVGRRAPIVGPRIQLDLAMHATRMGTASPLRNKRQTATTSMPGRARSSTIPPIMANGPVDRSGDDRVKHACAPLTRVAKTRTALTEPSSERLTSPLTVRSDLRERRSAQR